MISRTTWPMFAFWALLGCVALGAGAALTTASGSSGTIKLTVPGAMNLAVYCGGEHTHFADGETISFVPDSGRCDIEAPLSPVMPVRGTLDITRAISYRCARQAMELVCTGA